MMMNLFGLALKDAIMTYVKSVIKEIAVSNHNRSLNLINNSNLKYKCRLLHKKHKFLLHHQHQRVSTAIICISSTNINLVQWNYKLPLQKRDTIAIFAIVATFKVRERFGNVRRDAIMMYV